MKYAYRESQVLTESDLKRIDEGVVDWLQAGLDIVGLAPGVGEVADGINVLISIIRGNMLDAVFSAISMLPGVGDAVGKTGKYLVKLLEPAAKVLKYSGEGSAVIKALGPAASAKLAPVVGKVQPMIAKKKDTIGKVFTSLDAGDGDAVASAMGIKVPKMFKGKWDKVVKKAGPAVKDAGIDNTVDFIANVTEDQLIRAAGASEEEYEDVALVDAEGNEFSDDMIAQAVEEIRAELGESYIHSTSLAAHLYGEEVMRRDLRELAEHLRKSLRG